MEGTGTVEGITGIPVLLLGTAAFTLLMPLRVENPEKHVDSGVFFHTHFDPEYSMECIAKGAILQPSPAPESSDFRGLRVQKVAPSGKVLRILWVTE